MRTFLRLRLRHNQRPAQREWSDTALLVSGVIGLIMLIFGIIRHAGYAERISIGFGLAMALSAIFAGGAEYFPPERIRWTAAWRTSADALLVASLFCALLGI